METPRPASVSGASPQQTLPPPPEHIDLLLTPHTYPRTSITPQELLDFPFVRCCPKPDDMLANRFEIIHNIVPQGKRHRIHIVKVEGMVDTMYRCSVEQEIPLSPMFLMAGRKRTEYGITYWDFWLDDSMYKMRRVSRSYAGTIKSMQFEQFYILTAESPAKPTNVYSETMGLTFILQPPSPNEPPVWHDLVTLLPGVPSEGTTLFSYIAGNPKEKLYSRWKRRREPGSPLAGLTVLANNRPLMTDTGEKVLNVGQNDGSKRKSFFFLTAKKEASGNLTDDPDVTVVLNLERLDRDHIILDLTYPLTAYVAVALSLTMLDGKGASNFIDRERKETKALSGEEIINYMNAAA